MSNTILESIINNATLTPDKLAIIDSEHTLSYHQLYTLINRVATFLKHKGVRKGSIIMLSAQANTDFVVCYFSIQLLGAICVPYASNDKLLRIETISNQVNAMLLLSNKFYPFAQDRTVLQSELISSNLPDLPHCLPNPISISEILYTS